MSTIAVQHTWKPINVSAVMWYISCALHHARTYPAAIQKGVADLCVYINYNHLQMHVHTSIEIFLLRNYRYV